MRQDDEARGGKLAGGGGSAKGNPLRQKFQKQIIVTTITSKSKDFRAWVRVRRVRSARPLGDCVEILRKNLKSFAQTRKWRSTPDQNRPISGRLREQEGFEVLNHDEERISSDNKRDLLIIAKITSKSHLG